ncbi:MAG: metal ABC transporter ATP-binding protein [Treponema sp.]|jgi:zinc transport system ATP-binding protein|nr:metal ABC transporter ATP-binding protein [Treponema sp.]
MGKTLLSLKDCAFGYDGTAVLEGLSFLIEAGECFCIVGENGSGKSTLLKGFLGILPPLRGELKTQIRPGESGYLPQESAVQSDFPAAVFEVVLSGCQSRRGFRPFYSGTDKAAAAKNLELLGLGGFKRSCFRELSGGQRRRALLARALCAAEKILFLDEPAAGLDPIVRSELYGFLEELNRERGMTIIMVTHDIDAALRFTENSPARGRILHLAGNGGDHGEGAKSRQLFFGSPAEYRLSEQGRRFINTYGEE